MSKVKVEFDENIALVTMNDGENRFNYEFMAAMKEALDEVEASEKTNALVLTSSHAKIYSNGLDLDWLLPQIAKNGPEFHKGFIGELNGFLARLLTFPMITVGAINGHCFAAAAMMAAALDFRFMQTGRGFFCLPEVDINIPIVPGQIKLVTKAVPFHKFNDMQLMGLRLTAEECLEHHIVTRACPPEDLLAQTVAFAKGLNKGRGVVARMKEWTYMETVAALHNDINFATVERP